MLEAKVITSSIPCSAQAVYDAIWMPEMFQVWASGLSSSLMERDGAIWTAQGPEGPIRIRFTDRNSFGVMDHWVDLGAVAWSTYRCGSSRNGEGSEVMLILFRQPWMTPEQFAADEAWVRRDLEPLKEWVLVRREQRER